MATQRYRFTLESAKYMREVIKAFGRLDQGLPILKGKSSSPSINFLRLHETLNIQLGDPMMRTQIFDRVYLSKLLRYDITFKGVTDRYLDSLLIAIRLLIEKRKQQTSFSASPSLRDDRALLEGFLRIVKSQVSFNDWYEPVGLNIERQGPCQSGAKDGAVFAEIIVDARQQCSTTSLR